MAFASRCTTLAGGRGLTSGKVVAVSDAMAVEAERYLDHLTVERGLSEHTLMAYRRDLRRYLVVPRRAAASRSPDEVEEATVRSFVASLSASTYGDGDDERPYRATSVARTLSAVRSFHRFLVREGVADRDPAGGVSPAEAARARCRARSPSRRSARLLEAPDPATPVGSA